MGLNIKIEGLRFEADAAKILNGLDFELEKGSMTALVGPNGAGKSTLLRCIAGLLKPTGGSVFLGGQELATLGGKEIARRLAVVPQDTGVEYDFSVLEVVMMGRYPHRHTGEAEAEAQNAARQAMRATGIEHLKDRSAATLSGGERQRMVFARALCQQPRVFLLDEPTANLDIGFGWELLDTLARINRQQGVTVLAAIHDLNLAAMFFDQFLLMAQGKVMAAGSAEKVLTPENIRRSYGVSASVFHHPLNGSLQVGVAGPRQSVRTAGQGSTLPKVHVIAGGREALPVIRALWSEGFELTLSPLERGDSGFLLAGHLGIEVIEIPPFSAISPELQARHDRALQNADWVVVPPISFGEGNLPSLSAAARAVARGKSAAVFAHDAPARDFCAGQAHRLLGDILSYTRAHPAQTPTHAINLITANTPKTGE
jgi:iron complex transport system ATP-binding protein